jgi:hypothetical protein
MPYTSPAERERARWATIPEIVAYIMAADECAEDGARLQVQKALYAGELRPLKWEDAQPSPHNVGGMTVPLDEPHLTPDTEIDWAAGTLLDISEYSHPPGRHRRLLLLWLQVHKLWQRSQTPIARMVPPPASGREVDQQLSSRSPKTRGAYKGDLSRYLARYKEDPFAKMSDDELAQLYQSDVKNRAKKGEILPRLPSDRRNIAAQVAKIREKRRTASTPNNA